MGVCLCVLTPGEMLGSTNWVKVFYEDWKDACDYNQCMVFFPLQLQSRANLFFQKNLSFLSLNSNRQVNIFYLNCAV